MPARTPEEVRLLFDEALKARDLDALLALYSPESVVVQPTGETVTGIEDIRRSISGFLAIKPELNVEVRRVFQAGDTALICAKWSLKGTGPDGNTFHETGQSSEVVRRQPDGTWLFLIDSPYGAG